MTDECPNKCECARAKPSILSRLREAFAADNAAALDRILSEEWTPLIICRLEKGYEPEFAERLDQARRRALPGMKISRLVQDGKGGLVKGPQIWP